MDKLTAHTFYRSFPKLYNEKTMPGFPGEGWKELIRNLSEELSVEIEKQPIEDQSNFYCAQIKEKFGTLRYYLSTSTRKMDWLIEEAEDLSAQVCETCGTAGCLRPEGWEKVRCNACQIKYVNDRILAIFKYYDTKQGRIEAIANLLDVSFSSQPSPAKFSWMDLHWQLKAFFRTAFHAWWWRCLVERKSYQLWKSWRAFRRAHFNR